MLVELDIEGIPKLLEICQAEPETELKSNLGTLFRRADSTL
jgi:hypothetical protein